MEKMIKANMKPEFEIMESNRMFHHMRFEQRLILPNDPTHPIVRYRIMPIRAIDYEKYFGRKVSGEMQSHYLHAMNYASAELIHDPALEKPEKIKLTDAKSATEKEHEFRESRRQASVGDVQRLLKEQKS